MDIGKAYSLEKTNELLGTLAGTTTVTRTIYNVTLGPVDTEQSQVLPANVKSFIIKTRGNSLLKLSYSVGTSGTNYVTVPNNAVYSDDFFATSLTLYFQSPQTGDTVEIVAYS